MALIGCLAGIGFTMSIFIANLAFSQQALLSAAKLGVFIASVVAGLIGLIYGLVLVTRTHSADSLADLLWIRLGAEGREVGEQVTACSEGDGPRYKESPHGLARGSRDGLLFRPLARTISD
jgi:hypothetical protein